MGMTAKHITKNQCSCPFIERCYQVCVDCNDLYSRCTDCGKCFICEYKHDCRICGRSAEMIAQDLMIFLLGLDPNDAVKFINLLRSGDPNVCFYCRIKASCYDEHSYSRWSVKNSDTEVIYLPCANCIAYGTNKPEHGGCGGECVNCADWRICNEIDCLSN